jgi:hypothetical protein
MNIPPSGFLGNLSPSQSLCLKSLRAHLQAHNLSESQYDDRYLLRFLRARQFHLEKTVLMWDSFVKWSKQVDFDNIRVVFILK